MQGSVRYRLDLLEQIQQCFFINIKKFPGALLWVIRQFIGLLPLPVLPHYADGKFFHWNKLGNYCRSYLKRFDDEERAYKINTLLMQFV